MLWRKPQPVRCCLSIFAFLERLAMKPAKLSLSLNKAPSLVDEDKIM
jgi:hypothetical protein